jgi:hypothetical protein
VTVLDGTSFQAAVCGEVRRGPAGVSSKILSGHTGTEAVGPGQGYHIQSIWHLRVSKTGGSTSRPPRSPVFENVGAAALVSSSNFNLEQNGPAR